jgi:cytoskeletal protein CcmA (bactofilin family)
MESIAKIGQSIRIKGEVQAGEPLIVAGQVDGTVEVNGHPLTIDTGGAIEATVSADTIIVSGRASGLLTATAKIVIENSATVNGDVAAPSVSLAEGAVVNGRIETRQKPKGSLSLAS